MKRNQSVRFPNFLNNYDKRNSKNRNKKPKLNFR